MGKMRLRERHSLARGHTVELEPGFWILRTSPVRRDALSPPNQITPGKQKGGGPPVGSSFGN